MASTSKDIRLLSLLHSELILADSRYEGRRWDADHKALKRAKVEARIRYRRFFRGFAIKDGVSL